MCTQTSLYTLYGPDEEFAQKALTEYIILLNFSIEYIPESECNEFS